MLARIVLSALLIFKTRLVVCRARIARKTVEATLSHETRFIHGQYQVYSWAIQGLFMGNTRFIHGQYKGFQLHKRAHSMRYFLDKYHSTISRISFFCPLGSAEKCISCTINVKGILFLYFCCSA